MTDNMKTKMVLQPNIKPTVSTSQKATIIFTTFGIFGVMLASFFIFNLTEIPKKKSAGPNIMVNASFEKWNNNIPIGWINNNVAIISRERKGAVDEKYLVSISNEKSEPAGLKQTIQLNPLEIYNLYYSMKSISKQSENVGVEISYEGEDIKTTTDASAGIHYHEKGNSWHQYFGRVTGAKSVTLFFFAKNNQTVYIDAVAIGTNVMPQDVNEAENSFSK